MTSGISRVMYKAVFIKHNDFILPLISCEQLAMQKKKMIIIKKIDIT